MSEAITIKDNNRIILQLKFYSD